MKDVAATPQQGVGVSPGQVAYCLGLWWFTSFAQANVISDAT